MNLPSFKSLSRPCAAGILSLALAASSPAAVPTMDEIQGKLLGQLGKEDLIDDTLQSLTGKIFQTTDGNEIAGLIKDFHVEPKFFHVDGSGSDNVLGFDYSFKKSVANRVIDGGTNRPMGVSWTLDAKGSVAADAKKNPNSLLESGATLHWFQASGGVTPKSDGSQAAGVALAEAIFAENSNPEFQQQRGEAYDNFSAKMAQHLLPQFVWDLQAHATLESDQQFDTKAWTYGAKLALVGRDWRGQSSLGYFNVVDYPFAAIRWLFDHEDFAPSGRTLPSLVLGVDQVDPSKDDARLAIDPSKDKYTRGRAELAFKTRVLRWEKQNLYLSAAYRYFKETGASTAIKQAGLDNPRYFVAKLDLPAGFFVSYTSGKLPFDRKSDEVYAVGWKFHQ